VKTLVIIAISIGVSVVAVIGVLIGIGLYQQYQAEEELKSLLKNFENFGTEDKKPFVPYEETPSLSESPSLPHTTIQQTPIEEDNCDPSYPDFCIKPYPPDLDCKDVLPHKKFVVLPPDKHGFDQNKDGIGCEK
jgi:hypothetical protein